ncbi:thiopurine S-methyltransferase [Methylomonas sp. AM2-LC]|uniref:thiopurine S-methyltransferase n=1 Tax=Methylomonas sp. AM2-LC TaxID=3153301 RepID=UPI003263EA62
MQHDFWHQRWDQNQIGFHNHQVNPYLQRFWSTLSLKPGSRVFVPLCGKSNDMLWLLAQGYQVVAAELSPVAVAAFFAENNLHPTIRRQGEVLLYEIDGLQLYCADFFDLSSAQLGHIDAVYDRASLVALPPEMRLDYVYHLSSLLESGQQILLVTFVYEQHEMTGPPFSVLSTEVDFLYGKWCSVNKLTSEDVLQQELHFKQRGLSSLHEQVYQLVVR